MYNPIYIVAIGVFILGLHRMGHPKTAKSGIMWSGFAMAAAVIITFTIPGLSNLPLILIAIAVGGAIGWFAAVRVTIADMPQMVAIYNGMGAGAAAGVASIELLRLSGSFFDLALALAGAAIGSVSISGSIIAFLKLQGWMRQRPITFVGQQGFNVAILAVSLLFGVAYLLNGSISLFGISLVVPFFVLSISYGFLMAFPIGGGDMPVVIALFNAMTGIAVAFDGFSLGNYAMMVAGIFVGAAGTLLTVAMARAMNRSLASVLFGSFGKEVEGPDTVKGTLKPIEANDAAIMLAYSERVMIVPGYGMAAAQAQFKIKELLDILLSRGIKVGFAIHPVAGRMPGHMNVLLAEAGVPYELMLDLEDANRDFPSSDVALVVGANDVVNPAAKKPGSPLYGMPILDVDKARNIIVLKRGTGKGFAGVINELFRNDKTKMLYGDATDSITKLIQGVKKL
ncbi:NAD(P) transhydrogenase subunit beta [uncultured archaeon]|nr:NAD(P) transhydrogenase subunit beta [uncultured archaeon]